jgi:mono/diheme cytochrome c family protein
MLSSASKLIHLLLLPVFLYGCSPDAKEIPDPFLYKKGRWYTEYQFSVGKTVFASNCAQCHGNAGQGLVDDWKTPNPDGTFPPPPLNGTAHSWHHSTEVLLETINNGGIPIGGNMPAFKEVLSDEEKLAAIAFFQNLWDDETYAKWLKINNSN